MFLDFNFEQFFFQVFIQGIFEIKINFLKTLNSSINFLIFFLELTVPEPNQQI